MSTMVATKSEAKPNVRITPEQLLEMPDGGHYELIDGEVRERSVSVLSNLIAAGITGMLHNHCQPHNLGWVLASELGYRCFPWKPGRVRRADVSFIRADRLTEEHLSEGFCSIPPDLAVEVVSPNDLVDKLDEKVEDYLRGCAARLDRPSRGACGSGVPRGPVRELAVGWKRTLRRGRHPGFPLQGRGPFSGRGPSQRTERRLIRQTRFGWADQHDLADLKVTGLIVGLNAEFGQCVVDPNRGLSIPARGKGPV